MFGGGNHPRSDGKYCFPAEIAGKEAMIRDDVVQSDLSLPETFTKCHYNSLRPLYIWKKT